MPQTFPHERAKEMKKGSAHDPLKEHSVSPEEVTMFKSLSEMMLGKDLKESETDKPYLDSEGRYHIYLETDSKEARCPFCNEISTDKCAATKRTVLMFTMNLKPVLAHITCYRYYCHNDKCLKKDGKKRKTFTESIDGISSYRRYTTSILFTIFVISIFCNAVAAKRICQSIGIDVERDTITRMLNSIKFQDYDNVTHLGIDDISRDKGVDYYTVVYDQDTHGIIAVLDGRDGKTLKEWLKQHINVESVARDRASAYAAAVSEILPQCTQVADRFHLFHNIIHHFSKIFIQKIPSHFTIADGKVVEGKADKYIVSYRDRSDVNAKDVEGLSYDGTPPKNEFGKDINVNSRDSKKEQESKEKSDIRKREKRQKIEGIRKDYHDGMKIHEICKKHSTSYRTVQSYIRLTDEEVEGILDNEKRRGRKSPLKEADNIIYKMLKDGLLADTIYDYVMFLGYEHSGSTLSRHIRNIAKNDFGRFVSSSLGIKHVKTGEEGCSRLEVLRYMTAVDPKKKKKMEDSFVANHFQEIMAQYPPLGLINEAWITFHSIFMDKDRDPEQRVAELYEFVCQHQHTFLQSFADGIIKDWEAVKNAIIYETSSGFVEGLNNSAKVVERMHYGRLMIKHFFAKFYISNHFIKGDIKLTDMISF